MSCCSRPDNVIRDHSPPGPLGSVGIVMVGDPAGGRLGGMTPLGLGAPGIGGISGAGTGALPGIGAGFAGVKPFGRSGFGVGSVTFPSGWKKSPEPGCGVVGFAGTNTGSDAGGTAGRAAGVVNTGVGFTPDGIGFRTGLPSGIGVGTGFAFGSTGTGAFKSSGGGAGISVSGGNLSRNGEPVGGPTD